jgi:hypothetical protein
MSLIALNFPITNRTRLRLLSGPLRLTRSFLPPRPSLSVLPSPRPRPRLSPSPLLLTSTPLVRPRERPRELPTRSAVVATAVLQRRLKRNSTQRWLTILSPLPLRLLATLLLLLPHLLPLPMLIWMRLLKLSNW